MKLTKRIGAAMIAGLVPLTLAVAQQPANSDSSQTPIMGNGHMMGNRMMTSDNQVRDLLTQLKQSLSALGTENDVAAIHSQVAQDQKLMEQLHDSLNGQCGLAMGSMGSHMQNGQTMPSGNGDMMGGGRMMGGRMSGSDMHNPGSSDQDQQ